MKLESSYPPKKLPTPGLHPAYLYQIVDLGTQMWESKTYGPKTGRRVLFTWEIADEFLEDGRPLAISYRYTYSAHEKSKLVKDLKSWLNKKVSPGFDLNDVLGLACLLNITINEPEPGKAYANIEGVTPTMKGMKLPDKVNPSLIVELTPEGFIPDCYEALPDWLKDEVAKAPEWVELQAALANPAKPSESEDFIPF